MFCVRLLRGCAFWAVTGCTGCISYTMLSSLPRHDWILSRHILLVCAYVGFAVLTLWVTSVTSAPLPLTRGKRIILSRNKHSRAPFYRCKLLGNGSSLHSFDAAHTDDQIWDRNKRWTECVLSPLLSRITLSCTPLYFKALPFLLHCRFQPSSPLFSIPLVTPPPLLPDRECKMS